MSEDVKPWGWPRVTPPDHPADPRSPKPKLEYKDDLAQAVKAVLDNGGNTPVSPFKFTSGGGYVKASDTWALPPIAGDEFYPDRPGLPWDPNKIFPDKRNPKYPIYPGLPYDPDKIFPFTPTPWRDGHPYVPYVPFPDLDEKTDPELLKKIAEAVKRNQPQTGREKKIQEQKAAEKMKIAELEIKVASLEERILVLEKLAGLIVDPEPIIARSLFQAGNIMVAVKAYEDAPDDADLILLTEEQITHRAVAYHGLTVEAWNDLTDDDRNTLTLKYILHVKGVE